MTAMMYCGLPSGPITGSRVAVAMRVPLPGVRVACSSKMEICPDSISLRSSASMIAAVVAGMASPAVLPSMRSRLTPRNFSAARLIRQ